MLCGVTAGPERIGVDVTVKKRRGVSRIGRDSPLRGQWPLDCEASHVRGERPASRRGSSFDRLTLSLLFALCSAVACASSTDTASAGNADGGQASAGAPAAGDATVAGAASGGLGGAGGNVAGAGGAGTGDTGGDAVAGAAGMAGATGMAGGGSKPTGPLPCDIYAAAGTPCVGAYSTVRALYAAYQVRSIRSCAARIERRWISLR